MTTAQGFRIDPGKVVHEAIDGEVILIHLGTGNYYSLDGAGAEIWELLGRYGSTPEIAEELAHRHGERPEALVSAVDGLIDELAAEGLLEVAVTPASSSGAETRVEASANGSGFERPVLTRYTDMQDFLLVDPIHEVADSGWPNRR